MCFLSMSEIINMRKAKKWLTEQSKKSKLVIIIIFILHISFATYKTPFYLLSQYGSGIFFGRLLGQLLGIMFPLILVSILISFILYIIFRRVAETYKKYFDYFVIVFTIISILIFWFNLSTRLINI